jgi:hypothetical protein
MSTRARLTGHSPHLTAAKYNTDSEGSFMIIGVEMERFTLCRRQVRGVGTYAGAYPDPEFTAKLEWIVAAWRQMAVAAGN